MLKISADTEFGAELVANFASFPPTKIAAISDTGEFVTYGELSQDVEALGEPKRGELVLIAPQNDLGFVRTYVSYICRGYSVLIMPPSQSIAQWAQWINMYAPERIVCDGQAPVEEISRMTSAQYGRFEDNPHASAQFRRVNGANPAANHDQLLLLPTSGSTGSLKVVKLGMHGLFTNAVGIVKALAIKNSDRALANLPFHYTYGLSILHSHLLLGASVFLTTKSFVHREFGSQLDEFNVSSMSGVPSTYEALNRLGFFDDDRLRLRRFDQAGGRLNASVVQRISEKLQRRGQVFQPMYGQTEATARIAVMPSDAVLDNPDCVGLPVANSSIRIGSHRELNEIMFSGPSVMKGYAKSRDDLGAPDTCKGLLATGDVGEIVNGFLRVTGRLKRIVKHRGVRISLDDIESRITDVALDHRVAVVQNNDEIKIYLESQHVEFDRNKLMDSIRIILKEVGILEREVKVASVASLPMLSSGKIDYQSLD